MDSRLPVPGKPHDHPGGADLRVRLNFSGNVVICEQALGDFRSDFMNLSRPLRHTTTDSRPAVFQAETRALYKGDMERSRDTTVASVSAA